MTGTQAERHNTDANVSFVIPARNEAATLAGVVDVCRTTAGEFPGTNEVIVVSDGSTDETAEIARRLGALVLERQAQAGSKADAMRIGVEHARGRFIFFVDADCVGLRPQTLHRIADPVLSGRVDMSVGTFDYRLVGGLVKRVPWSSGERILRRELLEFHDPRATGYSSEILMNESVGRIGGTTASMRMEGVHQRSKARKFGPVKGWLRNIRMWQRLAEIEPSIDHSAYKRYATSVVLMDAEVGCLREQSRIATSSAYLAMRGLAAILRAVPTGFESDPLRAA